MRYARTTEWHEQHAVIDWARKAAPLYPGLELLHHNPMGGKRDLIPAARLKAIGAQAGIPDLFLPVPRGGAHGLWIEMKANKGRVSPEQRGWIAALMDQGYAVSICWGAEQAINRITRYLTDTVEGEW